MKTFNKKMSLVEFRSQYWYKTDLQKICIGKTKAILL